MRAWSFAALCLLLGVVACGGSNSNKPTALGISPPGPVQASGPITFTATEVYNQAPITWSLTGPGTISSTSGRETVYRPPSTSPTQGATATLTAQADTATATVTINLATPQMPAQSLKGLTAAVQVTYDAQDIPHIACQTAVDCFAAQGYIQARDRLFPMDLLRKVARGRVSELIGTLGLAQDVQLRTLFTTRDGKRIEDALVAAMDPATAAKLNAFASGVNAYLAQLRATPGAQLPGEYAQLPYPLTPADIADWTPQDTYALARLQQFQLSETLSTESDYGKFAAVYGSPNSPLKDLGKIHAWIRAAAPPLARTHTLAPKAPGRAAAAREQAALSIPDYAAFAPLLEQVQKQAKTLRAALHPLSETVGSNNWVVDAAHSANGHAMVANDPHLSLKYPPLFHLATLTSANPADNLDVAGGAFPGIPGALVGRGKNVGWGVTVVGYDVTDLYLEKTVGCPPNAPPLPFCATAFNNSAAPVAFSPQSYKVRVGPGAAGLVDSTKLPLPAGTVPVGVLIVPAHGPVISVSADGKSAVSVRWTGHETNTQDLKAFLGLTTATDVDSAFAALKDYATGAQNFVLADDKGNIGYDPHALVPVRNFADIRQAGANVLPPWLPLPGDGSAEWGSGSAADNCAGTGANQPAATCWIPDSQLPQGKNPAKGFYDTANADPIGVSDDNNPLLHPPYLSFEWDDSTGFRHAQIDARLRALTANGGKVALSDMQSIQSDHTLTMASSFLPFIGALPATQLPPEVGLAQAMFSQWKADGLDCPTGLLGVDPVNSPNDPDAVHTRDSAVCFLFHAFLRDLLQNVFTDDLAVAGVGLSPVNSVKAMIYMLDPATPDADKTFCNDVDQGGNVVKTNSCAAQVVTAIVQAYRTIAAVKGADTTNWRWGRVHTVQPTSQLALVTNGYAPGPYARPGGAFTVDVGNPDLSAKGLSFGYGSGGNVRHISVMDPAAPIIKMQLPGPERDGPVGVFANQPDLLLGWVQNQYFDFAYQSTIAPSAVSAQTFNP